MLIRHKSYIWQFTLSGVNYLIDDLLIQLPLWIQEDSNDQQAVAFQRVRRRLRNEIQCRGLLIGDWTKGVFCDRAVNPLPQLGSPKCGKI